MKFFKLLLGIATACIALSLTSDCGGSEKEKVAKPIEIPLDTIWALDMPGTLDILQMKPGDSDKRFPVARLPRLLDSWFSRIRWALASKHAEVEAEAGFAIGPTSLRSLSFMAKILIESRDEPSRYQYSERETTAVFFHTRLLIEFNWTMSSDAASSSRSTTVSCRTFQQKVPFITRSFRWESYWQENIKLNSSSCRWRRILSKQASSRLAPPSYVASSASRFRSL